MHAESGFTGFTQTPLLDDAQPLALLALPRHSGEDFIVANQTDASHWRIGIQQGGGVLSGCDTFRVTDTHDAFRLTCVGREGFSLPIEKSRLRGMPLQSLDTIKQAEDFKADSQILMQGLATSVSYPCADYIIQTVMGYCRDPLYRYGGIDLATAHNASHLSFAMVMAAHALASGSLTLSGALLVVEIVAAQCQSSRDRAAQTLGYLLHQVVSVWHLPRIPAAIFFMLQTLLTGLQAHDHQSGWVNKVAGSLRFLKTAFCLYSTQARMTGRYWLSWLPAMSCAGNLFSNFLVTKVIHSVSPSDHHYYQNPIASEHHIFYDALNSSQTLGLYHQNPVKSDGHIFYDTVDRTRVIRVCCHCRNVNRP